jgi:hypothetical protein
MPRPLVPTMLLSTDDRFIPVSPPGTDGNAGGIRNAHVLWAG